MAKFKKLKSAVKVVMPVVKQSIVTGLPVVANMVVPGSGSAVSAVVSSGVKPKSKTDVKPAPMSKQVYPSDSKVSLSKSKSNYGYGK